MSEYKNAPQIRFKDFDDAWEQRKLGDIGNTFTGLSGKTKEDFGHGDAKFVTYMNVFSNPISNFKQVESVEIDSKQNEIRYGDIFFTTSSETPEEVGMSSIWLENKGNYYLNSFCFGFRPSMKFDPYFAAYMLRTSNVRNKITLLAQGISRYNISKNQMMNIEVPFPKDSEQIKLGKLFVEIDNLITLHQRKYDNLVNVKKSLLEKMFPKNSSNIPEIRFKGFTDAWEQRKLKELVHSVGTGKSKYNLSNYNKYPILGSRNIIGYDSSYDYSGDFILTARVGEYAGELYRYKGNVKITDNTVYLQGSDLDYLFYLLKKFNLKKLSFGSGQPLVKASELSNLDLFVSNNKTEKKKISELFRQIDNLITLHQRKQEKLNELKKSMLDKMFI